MVGFSALAVACPFAALTKSLRSDLDPCAHTLAFELGDATSNRFGTRLASFECDATGQQFQGAPER